MSDVTDVTHVPAFDGHASSSANYGENATWRNQIATLGPQTMAANLPLRTTGVARRVCMSVAKDAMGSVDGVAQISRILRERFAPDAIDSAQRDVAKFAYFKRTDQNMDA